MKKNTAALTLFTLIFIVLSNSQAISQEAFVTVAGEVEKPLKLDAATIQKMKHVNVKATAHFDHKEHTYSGILLSEIIVQSGAVPGNRLRGKSLAKYVLISASDGYQAVIALPEIDTAFTDKIIILADKMDGKALPVEAGPFQIIIPGDKKAARCVRQVVSISILSAKLD